MYKKKKNFREIIYPVALCLACFATYNINIPVDLNIQKIFTETFSVAAVNAGFKRQTLLEEITASVTDKFPKENKILKENNDVDISEKINIQEQTVTYENNAQNATAFENVFLKNHTSFEVALEDMMKEYIPPKRKEAVQILVIHTHATEGYADSPGSRTTETDRNMIKVGDAFVKALQEKGFSVVHDTNLHDYPSYNGSYANSLKVMKHYVEDYPDIDIIFDLHRDAVGSSDDSRVKFVTEINGKKAAQLMLVVGTNEGGLEHPSWQENLKFAAGLQNVISASYPDLMRAVDLRKERFNQHVTKNSIIVEVGSNGNTIEEALYSVTLLADALDRYIK